MNSRTIILSVLYCLALAAGAQTMVVRPLPFAQQLFTNQVYEVHQDREGFIWLGTTSSLQRWDGHRLLTFRNNDQHADLLTDNYIRDIEDTPDLLWIVGKKGLTLYDKASGRFLPPRDSRLVGKWINRILSDGADGLWATDGQTLFHCSSDGSKVEAVRPFAQSDKEGVSVNDIYLDRRGMLWLMCSDGTLLRRDAGGGFTPMPPLPNGGVACAMLHDADGRYWVGTWGKGLWQLFPDGDGPHDDCWLQHHVQNISEAGEEDIFFCIKQDTTRGWLWMLSYNKLYLFSCGADGRLIPVALPPRLSPLHYYTNMTVDREGSIWLTAYDGGAVVSFDDSGIISYPFPSSVRQDDADEEIPNIFADDDYIWINRQRHGLELMDRHTQQSTRLSSLRLPEVSTMRPALAPRSVWVAQRYYPKAYRLSREANRVTITDTADLEAILRQPQAIKDIIDAPDGTLWMLTEQQLMGRLPQPGRITLAADLTAPTAITPMPSSLGAASDVLCMADGALLRCSSGEIRITCQTVSQLTFLHDGEEVLAMTAEPGSGRLWIATTLGRTFRSDSTMQRFDRSPADDLLQDGLVQDMQADSCCVWMMNDKRIVCYDTRQALLSCYNANSGNILVKGFRHHALCADAGGVLTGGFGGLVHLPNPINSPAGSELTAVLTNVLTDGRSIFFDQDPLEGSTFSHVVLPADAHNIEFHLSVLAFSPTAAARVQCRLADIDQRWTPLDDAMPTAHYNSLPRGSHSLQVRLLGSDGEWSDPLDVAVIERLPAWYESWVAFMCYAVMAVVLLSLVVWRVRRRHARELQSEVEQAKVAIITTDHRLTDRMVAIIDQHMADSDFGLDQLLAEMAMSKTTLYRQLKDETDMTPADLIRSIRLKRASQMLLQREKTIAEVAYATGYSTPKYFTRCFKDEFGQTPSEYIRTHASAD